MNALRARPHDVSPQTRTLEPLEPVGTAAVGGSPSMRECA